MRFDILSLFPEMFAGVLDHSIIKIAQEKGLVEIRHWNIRDFAEGRHRSVDDRPFGGGPGMVMMPGPIFRAVETVQAQGGPPGLVVMLAAHGRRLTQTLVQELAAKPRLLLVCGRYEGIDERVRLGLAPLEVSIGDYVVSGGEIPAMVLVDAITRLVPGVLGDETSAAEESFSREDWVEYPQYTRPREFRGMKVPDVLLNGNHAEIKAWREQQALDRTQSRRRGSFSAEPPRSATEGQ